MVECDTAELGCSGGYLNRAWNYLEFTGIVSEACEPYTSGAGSVAKCPKTCTDTSIPFVKYSCEQGSTVAARTETAIKE